MIAAPGNRDAHHAVAMYSLPFDTINPHPGVGGGIPAPRKLSEDSTTMAQPTCKVMRTNIVFITFGKRWRKIILAVEHPVTRAC